MSYIVLRKKRSRINRIKQNFYFTAFNAFVYEIVYLFFD